MSYSKKFEKKDVAVTVWACQKQEWKKPQTIITRYPLTTPWKLINIPPLSNLSTLFEVISTPYPSKERYQDFVYGKHNQWWLQVYINNKELWTKLI